MDFGGKIFGNPILQYPTPVENEIR